MAFQETMKAISDPIRREILTLLRDKPLTAGEISDHFPITAASISHHLSILKGAGLVLDEKRGKYIYYELSTTVLEEVLVWFEGLKKQENLSQSEENNHEN